MEDIFNEDYLKISSTNNKNKYKLQSPNKIFTIEILLIGKKERILVEKWEFHCEFPIDWESHVYPNEEEKILILNASKNISQILKILPNLQSQKNKLGFKIYSGRSPNFSSLSLGVVKSKKFFSAGKRVKMYINVDYLDNNELSKIKDSQLLIEKEKVIYKRRRFFSEGDAEEFRIKIYEIAVIKEDFFPLKKQNKSEPQLLKDDFKENEKLNELIKKYNNIKEVLNIGKGATINYWSYLNLYFNQVDRFNY